MKVISKSILLAVAASVLLSQNVWAGGLYTWTDKNGVVHITNSPTEAERAKAKKARKKVVASTPTDSKTDIKKDEHEFIRDVRAEQKYEKDQIDKARKDAIDVLNFAR